MVLGSSGAFLSWSHGVGWGLRDITSKDSLLRPALSLGNKEGVAVLLYHRKGQIEGETVVTLESCLTHCIVE